VRKRFFTDRAAVVGRYTDRGSATVWSVGAIAVLCAVFGVVLALGQAVTTRHRAAGGADLAALTAADHWMEGSTAACARADRVARAQGARLVRCVIVGEVSDVTAASGRGPFAAEVRARAGPAGSGLAIGPAGLGSASAPAGSGLVPGPAGPGLGTGPAGLDLTTGPAGPGLAIGPEGVGRATDPVRSVQPPGPATLGPALDPAESAPATAPCGRSCRQAL
jgi:secretion/DNA translocation related TadE-like protein